MKSGDKAFVHLAGVVYDGIVKRAFLSGLGIPSVWIEWPGYQSEAIANDLL
jgi:hypothetical protein